MFLRAATLLLLSMSSIASAIDVSMIDMEDILQHHHVVMDSSDPYEHGSSSYARGVSLIKSELKNLLMKTANQDIGAGASSMDPSWHKVQTTFLSSTSDYHQDHKHDDGTLVEDQVGFVALNTNNDAYFDHPDMKVPIHEGAFIRFNGSEPHRTVVNKGNVHLLGPFDLKSFGKVGWNACCDTDTGECYAKNDLPFSCPDSGPTFSSYNSCDEFCTKAVKAGKAPKALKAPKGSRN